MHRRGLEALHCSTMKLWLGQLRFRTGDGTICLMSAKFCPMQEYRQRIFAQCRKGRTTAWWYSWKDNVMWKHNAKINAGVKIVKMEVTEIQRITIPHIIKFDWANSAISTGGGRPPTCAWSVARYSIWGGSPHKNREISRMRMLHEILKWLCIHNFTINC